jgi:hypothetical protein
VADEVTAIYLCARCFSADGEPGLCPRCGTARVQCAVGEPDDPARRPLMDAAGRVVCRAPLWWLAHTTPYLRRALSPRRSTRI